MDKFTFPAESLKEAEELANKAISLGDIKAYSLLSLLYMLKRQFDEAVAVSEKGLSTHSNWPNYNAVFSVVLMSVGRNDEAISLIERAIRLNPITPA